MRSNQLKSLPVMLHRLPLDNLKLQRNPLKGYSDDLLKLPTPELFKFLSNLASNETKWNQLKVALVGEEGVRALTSRHPPRRA